MADDPFAVLPKLRQVSVFTWKSPDDNASTTAGYALRFDEATLMFEVDPNTDEILVQVSIAPELLNPHNITARNASADEDWAPHIGADCAWWWRLTNQQGYSDGVQLELRNGHANTIRQWIAEASTLTSATFTLS